MYDFLDWLGLTKAQAKIQADQLGLTCSFIDTQDPKETMTHLIGKTVNVNRRGDQLDLTVAYFIPGI